MRISQKLTLTLSGLIIVSLISFLGILYLKSQHELQQLSSSYGQSLAKQVAQFAAEPLFAKDLLSLNVVVNQLQSAEHLAYAAIVDVTGSPLAEFGSKPTSKKGVYKVPIRFQASRAGFAIIAIDQDQINSTISSSVYLLLIIALVMLVVSALVISGAVKHIINGLQSTTFAFRELAQGQLGTQIHQQRNDELGELITSFNQLSQGLNERDQLLHPTTTKPMAQRLNNTISNGYIHITQMFVDLSEVSRHIDKLSADGNTQLLNIYHQLITVAAHHYDCDSCRFDRGGIAIRFLASDPQEASNACLDAICASQLALRLIDRLNQTRFERHLPTIRVSIGLHQGFGYASHIENGQQGYTAFLSEVDNDATRLAKLAQKGKIAMSQAALETANAGQVIQVSAYQVQPMTDFNSELNYAILSGLSPQLRKPIQIQADELFHAMYPRVLLSDDEQEDIESSDILTDTQY